MPKIIVTISDELDCMLREHIRTRGDLSAVVSDALSAYLSRVNKHRHKIVDQDIQPVEFSRSQRFGVGYRATLTAKDGRVVVEVTVDQLFRDRYNERVLGRLYSDNVDHQFPLLEHASRTNLNKLHGVDILEQADRNFYLYLNERLKTIRTWAQRQLDYHHCGDLPLEICFDEESGLWLCPDCREISGEGQCWSCKLPRPA